MDEAQQKQASQAVDADFTLFPRENLQAEVFFLGAMLC